MNIETNLFSEEQSERTFPLWINKESVVFSKMMDDSQIALKKAWKMPEKNKKQVRYYLNPQWRCCMEVWKIANIFLDNETTEEDHKNGIKKSLYLSWDIITFTQIGALKYAQDRGLEIPSIKIWEEMEAFFGWFWNLKAILQIPNKTWFYRPETGALDCAIVWCRESHQSLKLFINWGKIDSIGSWEIGCGLRLLDQ